MSPTSTRHSASAARCSSAARIIERRAASLVSRPFTRLIWNVRYELVPASRSAASSSRRARSTRCQNTIDAAVAAMASIRNGTASQKP